MTGKIVWTELMAPDPKAACAYYTAVAGWAIEEMDMGEGPYFVASAGGEMVAGIMGMDDMPEGVPPHWMSYIGVDDVDAACAAVKQSGGTVIREPWDIPTVGRIAIT